VQCKKELTRDAVIDLGKQNEIKINQNHQELHSQPEAASNNRKEYE